MTMSFEAETVAMVAALEPGAKGHGDSILPHHAELLVRSAISPEVAAGRGYRSVKIRSHLEALGFSRAQCRIPALLVPLYGPKGEVAGYQSRPDGPTVLSPPALALRFRPPFSAGTPPLKPLLSIERSNQPPRGFKEYSRLS